MLTKKHTQFEIHLGMTNFSNRNNQKVDIDVLIWDELLINYHARFCVCVYTSEVSNTALFLDKLCKGFLYTLVPALSGHYYKFLTNFYRNFFPLKNP